MKTIQFFLKDYVNFLKEIAQFCVSVFMFALEVLSWPFIVFAELVIYLAKTVFNKTNFKN